MDASRMRDEDLPIPNALSRLLPYVWRNECTFFAYLYFLIKFQA